MTRAVASSGSSRGPGRAAGRVGRLLAAVAVVAIVGAGCQATPPEAAPPSSSSTEPTTAPPTTEPAPDPPRQGACYHLAAADAVSPTSDVDPIRCRRPHTSQTFHVGRLDLLVDGHLVAVDSDRVSSQLARTCPRRLARFLGAGTEALRLSMLRAIWFAPTLEEADAGADWFRCDVVALAADGELLEVTGSLRGALSRPAQREHFGVCGTARPGAAGFARVACAEEHTWRAVATYEVGGRAMPDERVFAQRAGQVCKAAAEDLSDDPLTYEWGYDRPTAEQWRAGQRWGLCWVPD